MKIKSICLALIALGSVGRVAAQSSEAFTPIVQRALSTLHVPGFADFLVADGDAVWATNQARVEKLQRDRPGPVAMVQVPEPCGAMAIGFGSLWVANCQDLSLYRVDLQAARVTAVIPTGLADPNGELSIAVGAGSVWRWTLNQGDGSVTRIDPSSNKVIATIPTGVEGPGGDIATGAGAVWVRASKVLLSVILPGTNSVIERFGPPAGSGAVRVAGKFVWVTAHDIQTVWILPKPKAR